MAADRTLRPLRVLVAGCGRMGSAHARAYRLLDADFTIAGLVSRGARSRARLNAELGGGHPEFGDFHEALARTAPDAVCISTPDHWHAQPAIEAAMAGKDIYLQKPASLTVKEGRQMADAIKKNNRIFQMGSQQRSDKWFRLGCELVRRARRMASSQNGARPEPSEPGSCCTRCFRAGSASPWRRSRVAPWRPRRCRSSRPRRWRRSKKWWGRRHG